MLGRSGLRPLVLGSVQLGRFDLRSLRGRPNQAPIGLLVSVMIAALFVEKQGCYSQCVGVDCWDQSRDARNYDGPWPVVAHPPCARWCMLAGLVQVRWGHKKGDDEGCFESALSSVRQWGGVLEHPAYSDAWAAFSLPDPPTPGGWIRSICGGWVAHVEQGNYGHPARKATWLYAYGCKRPAMRWGPSIASAHVSWCGNHLSSVMDDKPRIGKRRASATPIEFRDLLISMAQSAETPPR